MGFEPMNTGFADQRVSHFATGALVRHAAKHRDGSFNKRLVPLLSVPYFTPVARLCAGMA
jgi:hypothetical protein